MKVIRLLLSKKQIWLFCLAITVGLGVRVAAYWFSMRAPIYDEDAYLALAHKIAAGQLYADCCYRTYGYPLFVGLIFWIEKWFGAVRLWPVAMMQVLLDICTGLLLYDICQIMFKKYPQTAVICLWVYMLNPFTSTYVAFILSEIWGTFLLTFSFWILVKLSAHETARLRGWLAWGIFLGLFMYTRARFFGMGFLSLSLPAVWARTKKNAFLAVAAAMLGISLTSIYPTITNFVTYQKITPLPVVSGFMADMYLSLGVYKWPTIIDRLVHNDLVRQGDIHREYFTEDGRSVRPGMQKEYKNRIISYITAHPKTYILSRIHNVFFLWNQSNLFVFRDEFWPEDRWPVTFSNIVLLFLAICGIGTSRAMAVNRHQWNLIAMFVSILICYATFVQALLVPEQRHTIPLYPIVIVFASTSIIYWWQKLRGTA